MVIGIIGGGASGMAAAIAAAENPEAEVLLLERQARLGRKLQATGNGRCNLTNMHALEKGYHGDNSTFSYSVLSKFPPEETLKWFRGLGLVTTVETSGRVYPYSDQANSVLDVLRFALEKPNIKVMTGCEVEKTRKTADGFVIETTESTFLCDKLIVACGGLAGTKLGGTMSGYKILRSMGHHCTRLRPSLVQIKTDWKSIAGLKGVRANCHATICCDNQLFSESEGEIQFTEFGLSGPVIFEISRDVCQKKGSWCCKLDLIPDISEDQLFMELCRRKSTGLTASDLFTGILHNRLGRVLVQTAEISLQQLVSQLMETELMAAAHLAKQLKIHLTEPMGMDCAQVTAGGIVSDEFDASTLESKLVPGLFACGEVLDVDGDCGGYNLQWAWSSGRIAGCRAGGVR